MQIMVVTHSQALVRAFASSDGLQTILLEKTLGETTVSTGEIDGPGWAWPCR